MQPLASKYRPRTWSDMVGNTTSVEMLRGMVAKKKVRPALLLTGTRGTGKTTAARILAAAVQCRAPEDGTPCGRCESCGLGADHPDTTEVDAASHGGADAIRDLMGLMQLPPSPAGNRRVLILDEVHRLSGTAADALLKPLEDAPPRSVFLLLTTDPDRLPDTVLSRCLRFDFLPLTTQDLVNRLSHVVAAEGIRADPAALRVLADAARGSAREALMYLDRAVGEDGSVTAARAESILGVVPFNDIYALFDAVVARDIPRAVQWVEDHPAAAPVTILRSAAEFAQQLVLVKAGVTRSARVSDEFRSAVLQMASSADMPRLLGMAAAARTAILDVKERVYPDPGVALVLLVANLAAPPEAPTHKNGTAHKTLADLVATHGPVVNLTRTSLIRQFFDGELVKVRDSGQ